MFGMHLGKTDHCIDEWCTKLSRGPRRSEPWVHVATAQRAADVLQALRTTTHLRVLMDIERSVDLQ